MSNENKIRKKWLKGSNLLILKFFYEWHLPKQFPSTETPLFFMYSWMCASSSSMWHPFERYFEQILLINVIIIWKFCGQIYVDKAIRIKQICKLKINIFDNLYWDCMFHSKATNQLHSFLWKKWVGQFYLVRIKKLIFVKFNNFMSLFQKVAFINHASIFPVCKLSTLVIKV